MLRLEGKVPKSQSRRHFVSAAMCAGAALLLPPRALATSQIRCGLTPVFLNNDLEILAALKGYLEVATGRSVQLVLRRTYQEITSLLISGQLDAAWICGFPFVANKAELALVAVPVWRGQPLYQSYLITGDQRIAANIDGLNDDIHAFSDPDSNSGYLVTCALLASKGLRPNSFFSRTFFAYGHRNVVRAVGAGLAHSGSVDGYVWEVMTVVEPELTRRTRVIYKSEWLGFPPIAAALGRAQATEVIALRQALIDMSQSDSGRGLLKLLYLDGFAGADASLFDDIAVKMEIVRRLG
ncbi:MAG: PhnD/SsuA/transferrin family substrate-binding protein [Hyphomicrobiales bacterium]|nr:PhnD/SsuA/transferrin family substrate-binding protein [Hyphomicrobiales bacterium]